MVWSFRGYPSVWKQRYWNDKTDNVVSIPQGTGLSHCEIQGCSCLTRAFSNDVPNLNTFCQFKKSLVHCCTNLRLRKCSPSRQVFWQRVNLWVYLCSQKRRNPEWNSQLVNSVTAVRSHNSTRHFENYVHGLNVLLEGVTLYWRGI